MRRRRLVQRWPAVPIAAKAMARKARSRSAEGVTIAALLPPSSRIERGRSAARGAAPPPGPSRSSRSPRRAPRARRRSAPRPPRARRRAPRTSRPAPRRSASPRARRAPCTASAVSGVFSEGFHTTGLPQTKASAAFHDQTATGKLKAVMTPHTPIGCQVSIMRWPGRSVETVRPCNWRERPTAKSQMSIISCTSPRPSETILPASMVTRRPRSDLGGAQLLADEPHELASAGCRHLPPGEEGGRGARERRLDVGGRPIRRDGRSPRP